MPTGRSARAPRLEPKQIPALTGLLAGTAALLSLGLDAQVGNAWGATALLLGVLLTELRPVSLARRGHRQTFTLVEGPLVAALAVAPGRYAVLAVAGGLGLAQLLRSVAPYKALFNVSQYALATAAAVWCAQSTPGVAGVVLGIAVFALVNDGAMRLVLRMATGQARPRGPAGARREWLLHLAAVTSVALIAAQTLQHAPSLLPAFLVPALLLQRSQEQASRRRARGSVTTALAEQAASLYGRSSSESAALVLRSARELLAARGAEIVLLADSGATSLTDPGRGRELVRGTVPPADLLTGWRGRVLEAVHATAYGTSAGVVIGRRVPHALLQVTRGKEQERFGHSDLLLLQELADNVEAWLDVDAARDDAVAATRRRAVEVGGVYSVAAEALGVLDRVRYQLTTQSSPASLDLADELRIAEESLAVFVSELITLPVQRETEVDTVQTGPWVSGRA